MDLCSPFQSLMVKMGHNQKGTAWEPPAVFDSSATAWEFGGLVVFFLF